MGVIIAGMGSGCGKTTISIGLMAALKDRVAQLAPFKVGPDYIDPGFHEYVTGMKSHNLDAFLCGEDCVRYLYSKYADGKCAIIEGVMGMYDGSDIHNTASSAHAARIIGAPVILIVDGKAASASVAAIVKGFIEFDKRIQIAGVIVNRVSGDPHYQMIKAAVETYTGIPCLGFLPQCEDIALESRHLGLIPHQETAGLTARIDRLKKLIQTHVDIDRVIQICRSHQSGNARMPEKLTDFYKKSGKKLHGKRIGIARDTAFSFYYQANLDLLNELGAELIPFSPMHDATLPNRLDAVYIGGGFPEVFGRELAENQSFISDLRKQLEGGLNGYAECGGFMYLSKSIKNIENQRIKMVGFYDMDSMMTERLQRFGYVTVHYDGLCFNAHEFHHSCMQGGNPDYRYRIGKQRTGQPAVFWECGAKKKNMLAGYPHLHFYAAPELAGKVFFNASISE